LSSRNINPKGEATAPFGLSKPPLKNASPSLAKQITPVLPVRFGGNGIAGVSCTLAPSFNNRLYRVVTWHDLKAGHGWEGWL
jgi:hypothetical protein